MQEILYLFTGVVIVIGAAFIIYFALGALSEELL